MGRFFDFNHGPDGLETRRSCCEAGPGFRDPPERRSDPRKQNRTFLRIPVEEKRQKLQFYQLLGGNSDPG